MIHIEFEIVKDNMTFRDAIILPSDHNYTDEQLEGIKQKRFDDWYAIVIAPQDEEETDVEYIEEE